LVEAVSSLPVWDHSNQIEGPLVPFGLPYGRGSIIGRNVQGPCREDGGKLWGLGRGG
jgi:hypothetical protein